MAVQAAITQFRQETVAQFEQSQTQLAMATTRESMRNGLSSVFLVSGSNGDTAVTRGANGDIPFGGPTNSQVTITLKEKHAAKELTGFDVFASQGNQAAGLRRMVTNIMHRDQDLVILAALAAATNDFGTGVMDLTTVLGATAILGNNQVPTDEVDNMFGIISPAANAYMMQFPEFSSADYVDVKPYANGVSKRYKRWADVNWIVSPMVTGLGTSSEILYIFHRAAIGYSSNLSEAAVYADYEQKHARSWARAELYHEAGLLQNAGVIKITHDGSAFVAT
jgi:hypothetical protein